MISDNDLTSKINIRTIGYEIPAVIELSEKYLNNKNMKIKTNAETIAACGWIAMTEPNKVATPFPPLNPA